MSEYKCEYCGKDLKASVDNYISGQVDHIIPRSKGGTNDPCNLADSCWQCNFLKRAWDPRKIAGAHASRDELIRVVQTEMKKWRQEFGRDLGLEDSPQA